MAEGENIPNEYPLHPMRMGLNVPRITDDAEMDHALHSPNTVYYKFRQVWQHYIPDCVVEEKNETLGTVTKQLHLGTWGVFFSDYLKDTNANQDFPWETTIGLNIPHKAGSKLYGAMNFIHLPERPDGSIIPILLIPGKLRPPQPARWIFPPKTIVGEIIYVTHNGKNYIQEIRTRQKTTDQTKWFPNVYRPVKNQAEFTILAGIPPYTPTTKYMFFRNSEEDEVQKLEGHIERLPDIPESKVIDILKRDFKKVTNENWHPMAEQDFHILPKDYSFGVVGQVDAVNCARCHNQTQISVRNLIPKEPIIRLNPQSVGNIRGSDGIFTWQPFELSSIRASAYDPITPNVEQPKYRDYDLRRGIIKVVGPHDPNTEDYKMTLYVQEALLPYELPESKYLHPTQKGKKQDD
jgi:hypothetical protein